MPLASMSKVTLDLRHAPGGAAGDAVQTEHTQSLVIFCHLTLTLEDMDLNRSLAVSSGGEDLGLLWWGW